MRNLFSVAMGFYRNSVGHRHVPTHPAGTADVILLLKHEVTVSPKGIWRAVVGIGAGKVSPNSQFRLIWLNTSKGFVETRNIGWADVETSSILGEGPYPPIELSAHRIPC